MTVSFRPLILALLTLLVLAPAVFAGDGVIEVNSLADLPDADIEDGVCDADLDEPGLQCTLRAAIMHLNAAETEGDPPQILLPEGTIKLKLKGADEDEAAFGDLDILVPMEIVGEGPDLSFVDGGGAKDRVFDVFAPATFTGLTIQKGKAVEDSINPDGRGGGIRALDDVSLIDVVVTKCSAPEDGGGMSVEGGAEVTVERSLFLKNKTKDDGAAIDLNDSSLIAIDTTFEGNKAKSEGGAIEGTASTIELINVTLSKNGAKDSGAAINLDGSGTVSLLNCTLANNKCKADGNLGASDLTEGEPVEYTLENTILFSKKVGNCAIPVTSSGGNIENGDSCGFGDEGGDGVGDLVNTDPLLAKKAADNGGAPVLTLALDEGSPAIDFANDGSCPPQDARGVDRVDVPGVGGSSICDSGAYEFAPPPVPNEPPTADAGPDQMVTDTDMGGDEDVMLDGSGSTDTDGTITEYVWTEGGGEIATGEMPMVTLDVGVHTIVLTVTDDGGETDTDTVEITVLAGGANQPPTADAGPDQMVTDTDMSGDEDVDLDGSGSSDPDGTIASYVWTEGGGQIATGMMPTVNLAVGTHTIVLTVTDDDGAMDTDTVVVMVDAGAAAISWSADLQPYFTTNCVSCHGGGTGIAGVNLDSWAAVIAGGNNGDLVVAFDSTMGLLVPKLESGHQGAPHGTNVVQELKDWIDAGALGN